MRAVIKKRTKKKGDHLAVVNPRQQRVEQEFNFMEMHSCSVQQRPSEGRTFLVSKILGGFTVIYQQFY